MGKRRESASSVNIAIASPGWSSSISHPPAKEDGPMSAAVCTTHPGERAAPATRACHRTIALVPGWLQACCKDVASLLFPPSASSPPGLRAPRPLHFTSSRRAFPKCSRHIYRLPIRYRGYRNSSCFEHPQNPLNRGPAGEPCASEDAERRAVPGAPSDAIF